MPSLKKLLAKFTGKERAEIESLVAEIIALDWRNLDIKQLTGYGDLCGARKGSIRVIFSKREREITIFKIDRRNDHTYKNL